MKQSSLPGWLAVMVLLGGCARDGDGAQGSEEPPPEEDGGAAAMEEVPCDELLGRWERFTDTHRACDSPSDCVAVGGPASCDCEPQLGSTAISRSARGEVASYEARFASPACAAVREATAICDAPPTDEETSVDCLEGRCVISQPHDCGPWQWLDDAAVEADAAEADASVE